MKLEIITHHACGRCKAYVKAASRYVNVIERDLADTHGVEFVPASFLYDKDTLVKKWIGATLEPFFDAMKGERMKVKFTTDCHDKYTMRPYKKGTVKEFPEERARELIEAGVAKEVVRASDSK